MAVRKHTYLEDASEFKLHLNYTGEINENNVLCARDVDCKMSQPLHEEHLITH